MINIRILIKLYANNLYSMCFLLVCLLLNLVNAKFFEFFGIPKLRYDSVFSVFSCFLRKYNTYRGRM